MRRLDDGSSMSSTASASPPSQWSPETDDASAAIHDPRAFVLPMHYEARYEYPLIVWLHGDGGNEHQIEQLMPHISLRNHLAVGIRGVRAADTVGHRFDWPQSDAAVHATWRRVSRVLEEARARFSVHPERIILGGYGAGGTMALRMGLREPSAFGGIISLGGALPDQGKLFGDFQVLRHRRLPVLWQWATEAPTFSPSVLKNDLRRLMPSRCRVEIRQYLDDDEMNTVTLSDINRWIMQTIVTGVSEPEPTVSAVRSFSIN